MQFANRIYNLREKEKMSQEEFAEIFGVSRQAVQKWENGTSLPDISKITEISKYFGISIDYLLLGRSSRMSEELMLNTNVFPAFEDIPDWEFYASSIMDEYRQSVDEGLDVEEYKALFEAVARLPKNSIKKDLGDIIHKIVTGTSYKKDYKYNEPSQLSEIKKLRKDLNELVEISCVEISCDNNENHKDIKTDLSVLKDKIYGAWYGRVSGCMLGKTVEGIRYSELTRFLTETDNYPMNRYILKSDLNKVDLSEYNYDFPSRRYADDIDGMPMDDDTNYTVIGQKIIEEYTKDFTPLNVIETWCRCQSKDAYCTAERVAFCNYIKGYRPPNTAIYKNPYREWIGAQIRGDYWGYINPGDPEKAAEMAWRDASISHIKNGIYGEMFVAAMIAVAAETSDLKKIILTGLSQIPYTSRLYEEIMQIIDKHSKGETQKQVFEYIHKRYNEGESYGWVHTISNAMIVTAALLFGEGDFGKSICMAVETGFDTDCNGATVGSILGIANGIDSIGKEWTDPFNDKLETSIFGLEKVKISDMAEKTLLHIKEI